MIIVKSAIERRANIFILLLLFLVHACAKPPEARLELLEEIPVSWVTPLPEPEVLTGPWWQAFADTTFNRHYQSFQQNSPDLRSIMEQMEIARQSAKIGGARVFPAISGSGTGSYRKQNLSAFGFSSSMLDLDGNGEDSTGSDGSSDEVISFASDNYGLNLSVQWEVDIWGKLLNERRAAFKDYEASKNDLIYLQFSMAARFANTYYRAVESAVQLQLATETTTTLTDIRNIVLERYNRGLTSSLDLRLAESSLAISLVQKENLATQKTNALRTLEVLLGKYPSASLEISPMLPESFPNVPEGLPAALIGRRPDIQAALQKAEASGYRVAQAKRSLLPAISLTASGGTSTSDLKDVLKGDYSVWNLGANLAAPLFHGGRLRANVALNESQFSLAEQHAIKQILAAFAEVEQTLAADASVQRQYTAILEAEQQAAAAYKLAMDRYKNGVTDLIIVLNSQQQWFTSQSSKISIQSQRINTRVNLLLVLGGDFKYDNHLRYFYEE